MALSKFRLKKITRDKISGRTALVTGASSGLGVDFAKQLAEAGANLILVARSEEKLNELKKELVSDFKVEVDVLVVDLSKTKSAKTVYDFSKEKNVTILLNNAGVGLHGHFLKQDLNPSAEMINLNVNTLVKLTHLFAKQMLEKSDGYILQTASVAGFMPLQGYSVYAATKAFVLSFSQAINWELEGTGVSSTALCPGATKTAFFETAGHKTNRLVDSTMMTSSEVATIGLEAMVARQDKVIAGMMNKMTVGISSALPSTVSKRLSAEFMK
ncbi:SDR family NAD(P)-dependent oxidoreductase [bacterium]|nr:SDR family NAD(P)-dependent oxidoreductase [bacterium]